jgi:hypothetical protein
MTSQKSDRTFRILATSALVLLSPLALSCDAVQPRPPCRAQMQKYAAKYTMVGSPRGNCAGKIPSAELVNMQYYRAKPDDPSVAPSLAIEPQAVFDAVTEAKEMMMTPVGTEYAIGSFSAYEPDANDICKADTLTESKVTIGPKSWGYKWSNVQFITKPLMNSIHFGADLTRTEDDCSVDLKVSAIYPAIYCGTGKKMEMGEDGKEHEVDDPTTGPPDNKLCDPVPGNNVHPDLALTCDASADGLSGSHLCVAAKAFPSLR